MVCDCGSVELKLEARNVLILVLMEYGLRLKMKKSFRLGIEISLNPCFNGIWSATLLMHKSFAIQVSLNPCFNGIWSATTGHLNRLELLQTS